MSFVWLYSPSSFQAFFNLKSEVEEIVFQYVSLFGEKLYQRKSNISEMFSVITI